MKELLAVIGLRLKSLRDKKHNHAPSGGIALKIKPLMSDPRTWSPPETLEETAKRLFVPGALYIRYLYRKELRRGEPEIRLIPSLADLARHHDPANRADYLFNFIFMPA